jgi:hypothetical protein
VCFGGVVPNKRWRRRLASPDSFRQLELEWHVNGRRERFKGWQEGARFPVPIDRHGGSGQQIGKSGVYSAKWIPAKALLTKRLATREE